MIKKIIIPVLCFAAFQLTAQDKITMLKADGPGGTLELIDSILAPEKGSAIESPGTKVKDCNNHSEYLNIEKNNDHITEIIDPKMGPVFKFVLHANEDIDRNKCAKKDRQRNEIKTYKSSPNYLKAQLGEKLEYKWTMKLPADFKASSKFTHLHQIKSVGAADNGDKMPLITFTAYEKSGKSSLNIRYGPQSTQETLVKIPLVEFKGKWVEFTETIDFKKGKKGKYHILIKNMENDEIILDFDHKGVMFKKEAELMRPKWGIYRSLKSPAPEEIKDESVLYGYFKISEYNSVKSE